MICPFQDNTDSVAKIPAQNQYISVLLGQNNLQLLWHTQEPRLVPIQFISASHSWTERIQIGEGGNFTFLRAKFPLPSVPSWGSAGNNLRAAFAMAKLPRQAALAAVPPPRGLQGDAPSPYSH